MLVKQLLWRTPGSLWTVIVLQICLFSLGRNRLILLSPQPPLYNFSGVISEFGKDKRVLLSSGWCQSGIRVGRALQKPLAQGSRTSGPQPHRNAAAVTQNHGIRKDQQHHRVPPGLAESPEFPGQEKPVQDLPGQLWPWAHSVRTPLRLSQQSLILKNPTRKWNNCLKFPQIYKAPNCSTPRSHPWGHTLCIPELAGTLTLGSGSAPQPPPIHWAPEILNARKGK